MPAMPPPTTRVWASMGTRIASRGSFFSTRSTVPLTMALALAVAATLSVCTQATCSRMEAISDR